MSLYNDASLVMIPSAYKDGKLYSIKPTDGSGDFTFSRSTSATRVGPSGYIEKETQNLLLQSNQFDTTWINSNTTETGGQSGYDGSSDAWLLSKSAANGMIYQSLSSSGIQTISVYAKQGTKNWMQIYAVGSSNVRAYYDLANGVLGAYSLNTIDRKIESVGNGWYRCSVTFDSSLTIIRFYVSDGNNDDSGTSGNIYIQDAQLEQGLVARDYIETTTSAVYGGITDNIPRLDYTDSSCPSLLLEPQRTNIDTQSEYIAGWGTVSNVTRTANYEESPEGVDNATRLEFTAGGYTYNVLSPSQVNGSTYTMSCYAKRNDSGTQNFGFFRDGSGTVDSIMALTSEWQRFEYTYTASNTSRFGLAGQSGADVSVYGFQVEKDASYATSYIPTYGSAVTKLEDDCSVTGATNLIGQSEGSFYIEINIDKLSLENRFILTLSNLVQSEGFFVRHRSSNELQFYSFGLTNNFDFRESIISGGTYKLAGAYKSGDVVFYVNGVQINTDTTIFSTPDLSVIRLGRSLSSGTSLGGGINQALLFKTRLSNEELAALTTI